ncbi:LuxE/PaaK family acyltransferase [Chryseobacterium hagamense]|uniref:Acyltransferase n=1 Tax=Chryseobacterium hagamense TaxID=395935 RepID=A0A511YPL6_9FLAO|nr:acyl transferase [Chryseobacterium hagamense]GEN77134.1 acyltransferase [Chryseobacterium hagamense]
MENIFNIKTEQEFLTAALEIFRYQYENIEIYKRFVDYLNLDPAKVDRLENIPFLPIEMFKNHQVLDRNAEAGLFFQSSGTTQMNLSRHFIADENKYKESIYRSFAQFIGKPEDFIFLGLLPSYLEKQNSSLIYMVDFLMNKSGQPENGYFLYNHEDLFNLLNTLGDRKVILFGVSFALLDFIDYCGSRKDKHLNVSENLVVIETGGMKGRKEEMTKDELLKIMQEGFKTERIYSEYSMTELLSQAYSLGKNEYECPGWMKIMIRNAEDPFNYEKDGRTGAINIIDLANLHSCAFIATQDLGKITGNRFQVLGRIDHSDIRGCSLLVS